MDVINRDEPFPHSVTDGFLGGDEIRAVNDAWPEADWSGWVRYDQRYEAKAASDLTTPLPAACTAILWRMARLDALASLGFRRRAVADLSLHGAGLHEMPAGPGLGLHLDACRHPRLGLRRLASAVLYVHDQWEESWGGQLELWEGRREARVRIDPTPGRLVVFATEDAYHAVAPVVCPAGRSRRSLALFFYGPPAEETARARALFVAPLGEIDPLAADKRKRAA